MPEFVFADEWLLQSLEGLVTPEQVTAEARYLNAEGFRHILLVAGEGLLTTERFGEFLSADGEPSYSLELGEAILAYLARSRARLMLVQIEDIAGEGEQANLPGTTDLHPNWRRRLGSTLEDFCAGPALARIAALVTEARQRAASE